MSVSDLAIVAALIFPDARPASESIYLHPAGPTLVAIAAEGSGILDDLYRQPCTAGPHPAVVLLPVRRTVTWPHGSATLQLRELPAQSIVFADYRATSTPRP